MIDKSDRLPQASSSSFHQKVESNKFKMDQISKRVVSKIGSYFKLEKEVDINEVEKVLSSSSKSAHKFKNLFTYLHEGKWTAEERKRIYDSIEIKFREIEHAENSSAWIQRADLLDGIDELIQQSKQSEQALTPFSPKPAGESKWLEGGVPLIPYHKLKSVDSKIQDTAESFFNQNKKIAELEHSGSAKAVQKFTKRNFRFEFALGIMNRVMTYLLGVSSRIPMFSMYRAESIARFSRKMGITSDEILRKKVKNDGSSSSVLIENYRGPRFLFGNSVRDYKKINDWFKRSWTSEASEEYLIGVKLKESKIFLKYGDSEYPDLSRVVGADSNSRLRFETIEAKEFGKSMELTGKVLNLDAVSKATTNADDPSYYEKKYAYSNKNLFGRHSNDQMESMSINTEQFFNKTEKLTKAENISDKKVRQLAKEIKKDKECQKTFRTAQHELLGGMYRVFDRSGTHQIVQRLAPADVHNYVAPLNGKPLTHKEAAEVLKKRLAASMPEDGSLKEELENLSQLIKIFEAQEKVFRHSSQATIDIRGTNSPVAAQGIFNQSRFLSQNDRKVMMYLHEDGNFSVHVFIGATGVNRVDVDQTTKKMKFGARHGDMQFGHDMRPKESPKKLRLGEWQGGFPINGSTVISFYLPEDFSLIPKLETYKKRAVYGIDADRGEVELKVSMGDPILIKTDILMAEVMHRWIPDAFRDEEIDGEGLIEKFLNEELSVESHSSSFDYDKRIQAQIKKLSNKEALIKTLNARLNVIRAEKKLAKELSLSQEVAENIPTVLNQELSERLDELKPEGWIAGYPSERVADVRKKQQQQIALSRAILDAIKVK